MCSTTQGFYSSQLEESTPTIYRKTTIMELMSGDDPNMQKLAAEVKRLKKENKMLTLKAARYDWLDANVKEVYLRPDLVSCEWCPDIRTKWEIPTLICSGPVGGMVPFGEAIDVLRNTK